MVQRKDVSTAKIVELYQKGLIGREIAEKLECSVSLVQQRLAKVGIKMRPPNERITVQVDKATLEKLYWQKKMHPRQIGEKLGIHGNTVIKKMLEFGIPMRTKSEARLGEMNPLHGVGHTLETKQKMSQAFLDGRRKVSLQNQYGNPTEYKGIVYRSTWEAGVAFYLDTFNRPYFYEYKSFPYFDGERRRSYTPDFYLPVDDFYVEVKGIFRDRDLLKIELAASAAGIRIELWDWPKLVELGIVNTSGKVTIGLDVIHKVNLQ